MYAEAQAAGACDAAGGAGADASGGQPGEAGQDDSDVVDAEIVDEDEPK